MAIVFKGFFRNKNCRQREINDLWRLASRSWVKAAIFLKAQQTAHLFSLFAINEAHLPRIVELMIQYADLPMDLADASLVLLAEELGHGRIISTDRRDFHTYRWKNHQPFCNLLETVLCQ